jgi:hypothetical protein
LIHVSSFRSHIVRSSINIIYLLRNLFFQDGLSGKRATTSTTARQPVGLERKASFLSDATFESISESETSTAPSSLQTIVRGPTAAALRGQYAGMISEYEEEDEEEEEGTATESSPASSPLNQLPMRRPVPPLLETVHSVQSTDNEGTSLSFANNLRKVSEQLLANGGRTRSSFSGPSAPASRPGSVALGTAAAALAVSPREQHRMMSGSGGGPASIGQSSSSGSENSRPGSQQSFVHPAAGSRPASQIGGGGQFHIVAGSNSRPSSVPGRPGSYAGPPNTVGLPPAPPPSFPLLPASPVDGGSSVASPGSSGSGTIPLTPQFRHHSNIISPPPVSSALYPGGGRTKLPRLSPGSYLPDASSGGGGLLSTISQAALSDDESPPTSHMANPLPKFNTAALARPSSTTARLASNGVAELQPNYENVETPKLSNRPPPPPLHQTTPSQDSDSAAAVVRDQQGHASVTPVLPIGQLRPTAISRPRIASPATVGPSAELTQGRYRAAAAQAKLTTIPGPEDIGRRSQILMKENLQSNRPTLPPTPPTNSSDDPAAAYLPMTVRKTSASHLPRAVPLSAMAAAAATANGVK